MRQDRVLRGGRVLRHGAGRPEPLEIRIGGDGRIAALAPCVPADGAEVIDLAGALVLPGLVDMHQHLDKSRTRALLDNTTGTLDGAIAAYRAIAPTITRADMVARARQTLEACSEHGTVAIRSHTNIEPASGLRGVEAMLEVREACLGRMRLQIVGHITAEATRMLPETRAWLIEAARLGIDAIGGVPAYSDRPLEFLAVLFDAAEATGLPIDIHLDEHLDASRVLFEALASMTKARGMAGRVVAGHCSALSALDDASAARAIAAMAEAGVAVVTLPAANLYLQGRASAHLSPRGLTRVAELRAAGVPVAAASDNIEDPFIPTGSGDALEIARWTLLAGHLGQNDLAAAFAMVSAIPASLIGLGDDWGIRIGARADLLVTPVASVEDLVAAGSLRRTVLVGGRIVASTDRWAAHPDLAS